MRDFLDIYVSVYYGIPQKAREKGQSFSTSLIDIYVYVYVYVYNIKYITIMMSFIGINIDVDVDVDVDKTIDVIDSKSYPSVRLI